jgi:hypothetical protein
MRDLFALRSRGCRIQLRVVQVLQLCDQGQERSFLFGQVCAAGFERFSLLKLR